MPQPASVSAPVQLQARLKPYDPQRGHVLRSLMVQSLGYAHFEQNDRGNKVYNVTAEQAKELRRLMQRPDDARCTTPAFDILPADQMAAVIKAEQKKQLGLTDSDMDVLQRPTDEPPDPRVEARKGAYVSREEMRAVVGADAPSAAEVVAAPPTLIPPTPPSPRPKSRSGSRPSGSAPS